MSRPYSTPLKTSSLLEGDVQQGQMRHRQQMFIFFLKEGIRELSDLKWIDTGYFFFFLKEGIRELSDLK